jgi:hypothetical protein
MKVELWVHSDSFGSFLARTLTENDRTTKGSLYRTGVRSRTQPAIKALEKELDRRSDFKYRIEVKEIDNA